MSIAILDYSEYSGTYTSIFFHENIASAMREQNVFILSCGGAGSTIKRIHIGDDKNNEILTK